MTAEKFGMEHSSKISGDHPVLFYPTMIICGLWKLVENARNFELNGKNSDWFSV